MTARALRILVVEDSSEDREMIRRFLLQGLPAVKLAEARNGEEGLALARAPDRPAFDCVILDLDLPGLSGGQVLEALRDPEGGTRVPVIVLTGKGGDGNGPVALKAGAQDFVDKAWVGPGSLARAVGNAIERHAMERTLRAQRAELNRQLQQKAELMREMNHRIKNNLQIVANLLYMQSAKAEEPVTRMQLMQAYGRLVSVAAVHAFLYRSDLGNRIDFGSLLIELGAAIGQTLEEGDNRVRLDIDAGHERVELTSDIALPLALILNELVTNAFKYAFPEGRRGTVTVRLRRREGEVELLVADDGVGLPPRGMDAAAGGGFGLSLVRSLVEQLGGDLTIDRIGPGTRFEIRVTGA